MGSDSPSRGLVRVGALAPDRLAAPDHRQFPPYTLLVTSELSRVGSTSERPRPGHAPSRPESFVALIGELSLRAVRSHPKS